jgi:hypothetical protein
MFNYNPDTQSHHLLMDLADNVDNYAALDSAVAVLVDWGIIYPEIVPVFMKELYEERNA